MPIHILGVACFYHDSSAAIYRDGELLAAVAEERFTRKKHTSDFPIHAINYCLEIAGIDSTQLDAVAFYEKPLAKLERVIFSCFDTWPLSSVLFTKVLPVMLKQHLKVPKLLRKGIGYKGEVLFVDHHLAHAASAFLVSPFDRAAILCMDGVGEWVSTSKGVGEGTSVNLTHEIPFPHSLGLLYSALTYFTGYKVNGGEGKVMGLAPYGKPKFVDVIKNKLIDIRPDGSFRMNMKYFRYHRGTTMLSHRFIREFGPPRKPESPRSDYYDDWACSLQIVLEEAVIKLAATLQRETGIENLCLGGGVALNSVANGLIYEQTGFKNLFIQPAAGDDGTSVGAAAYVVHNLYNLPRTYWMENCYLGPEFSDEYIRDYLSRLGVKFTVLDRQALVRDAAEHLAAEKIIGWYQGRMEFGPRALGNRSILADPRRAEMKDILNARVKHRESFRPFAPTILLERLSEYFELDHPSPHMLLVSKIKPAKRGIIPAVCHVDGTGRGQTVSRSENALFYDLIAEFDKITGVPVVLNTSFNVRGEPIVCKPSEAFACFVHTDMDALYLGSQRIEKADVDTAIVTRPSFELD